MKMTDKINLSQFPLLMEIGKIANSQKTQVYAVGGFVRDYLLEQPSKDIDFVVIGNGPEFARKVAEAFSAKGIVIYEKFGTALVEIEDYKLEFVGARKESYRDGSRNPMVEPADLNADLARRDFTINAIAANLSPDHSGDLTDPFNGRSDLKKRIIQTPLEPFVTFQDDPLRIMRAIRFATKLQFNIDEKSKKGMLETSSRLTIVSMERMTDEFLKILTADKPSTGFILMEECGALQIIFPEFCQLKGIEQIDGHHHKDVFYHTLKVLDNVAEVTQKVELRYAALVHDIAKPRTKNFIKGKGWTFHNHEEIGARMLPSIGKRLRFPQEMTKFAQKLTRLHLRPIALTEEEVTDSAYRRLLFQAGDELEDLITLCRADITSQNPKRVQKHLANFDFVVQRLNEVEEKDQMRAFQSPVRGEEIMQIFSIKPGRQVGELKKQIEEAILDGEIPNEYEAAKAYLLNLKQASPQ